MKKLLLVACLTALLAVGTTATASAASPADQGQISSDTLTSMGLGTMRHMTDQQGEQIRGTFVRVGGFSGFLQIANPPGPGNLIIRGGFGHALRAQPGTANVAALGGFLNLGPALLGAAFGIGGGVTFSF